MIAVFRYMMVCQAVAVVNYGGERAVWRTALSVLVLVLVVTVTLAGCNPGALFGYLKCTGKEQAFRYKWYKQCKSPIVGR